MMSTNATTTTAATTATTMNTTTMNTTTKTMTVQRQEVNFAKTKTVIFHGQKMFSCFETHISFYSRTSIHRRRKLFSLRHIFYINVTFPASFSFFPSKTTIFSLNNMKTFQTSIQCRDLN